MQCERVLLDDLVLYNGSAIELGEDGEMVDVYAPTVPSHVRSQVGLPVELRLEYPYPQERVRGYYVLESIVECMESERTIMRFSKLVDADSVFMINDENEED